MFSIDVYIDGTTYPLVEVEGCTNNYILSPETQISGVNFDW